MDEENKWFEWVRNLLSIAQTGIHYAKSYYEKERFLAVRNVAIEMCSAHFQQQLSAKKMGLDSIKGYCTPQVTVRAVIMLNNKILLVREKNNVWNLPGGYADINDSPSKAVQREIYEETNLKAKVNRVMAIYENKKKQLFHQYAIYFLCELENEKLFTKNIQNHEIDLVDFIEIELIDTLTLNKYFVEKWPKIKQLIQYPSELADFD